MTKFQRIGRAAIAAAAIATVSACANMGGLGEILGGVLGGGQGGQVTGTIQSVDTRGLVVTVRQSNGQNVALTYDSQTQVIYQNRNYTIADLEYGDQVTATVQSSNGGNYVSRVDVTQSASASGNTSSGNSQSIQGTVRQVDVNNGRFTVNTSGSTIITVTMPYNPTRNDLTKFQSLRTGDYVRFNGTYVTSTRVDLQSFY